MKLTDLTQIAVWAGISTVVGLAVFGGRTAVSNGVAPAPPQPSAAIGHCRVTATGKALHGSRSAAVKVSIVNPGAKPETVSFDVNVVSRRFTGSLVSRVSSPNDVQTATIVHREIRRTIAPGATMPVDFVVPSSTVALKTASDSLSLGRIGQQFGARATPSANALDQTTTTYAVEVSVNGKPTQLANFSMQNA